MSKHSEILQLAMEQFASGEPETALAGAESVLVQDPSNADALVFAGQIHHQL